MGVIDFPIERLNEFLKKSNNQWAGSISLAV